MTHLVLEENDREKALEVARTLWEKHNVTGEILVREGSAGRWVVEVSSEKELNHAVLEKLKKAPVDGNEA